MRPSKKHPQRLAKIISKNEDQQRRKLLLHTAWIWKIHFIFTRQTKTTPIQIGIKGFCNVAFISIF